MILCLPLRSVPPVEGSELGGVGAAAAGPAEQHTASEVAQSVSPPVAREGVWKGSGRGSVRRGSRLHASVSKGQKYEASNITSPMSPVLQTGGRLVYMCVLDSTASPDKTAKSVALPCKHTLQT